MITPSTRLVRNPSLVAAELDGETVMLSVEMSRYYGLDAVGGRVWELLAQPTTLADLCATLQREYDVLPGQCEREVAALASELVEAQLVHIVEHPTP